MSNTQVRNTQETPEPITGSESGPETMSRWLWIIYPIAITAMFVVWGGVMQVLLGKQIALIVPDAAGSAAALGTVSAVAAISSVISQPVMGWLSDRTKVKFLGRRNFMVFAASIVGALGLLLQAGVTSVFMLAFVWAALMWPLNGVQAALTAVLPERVPIDKRGGVSGLVGAASMLGMFVGVAFAGLSPKLFTGYLFIAAVFLLIAQIFAWTTEDVAAPIKLDEETPAARQQTKRLPRWSEARDYWLTFIARFLVMFGYFSVTSFQLYILRDHIGIGDTNQAAVFLVSLSALTTALGIGAAVLGGFIVDKVGHIRLFVALSSALMVPGALVYWFVPTSSGAWVAAGTIGLAFGAYMAVDQALISRVIPNIENAARDLGIMNIANAGPQIVAPAITGLVVGATASYLVAFSMMVVCSICAAIVVMFVRGVN